MTKYIETEIPWRVYSKESAACIYVTENQYTQIAHTGLLKENTIYVVVKAVEVEE